MPDTIDPKEFGKLQAEVQHLKEHVVELRDDVKELLAAVENARGGWKTLLLVGTAFGTLGAFFGQVVSYLGGKNS